MALHAVCKNLEPYSPLINIYPLIKKHDRPSWYVRIQICTILEANPEFVLGIYGVNRVIFDDHRDFLKYIA